MCFATNYEVKSPMDDTFVGVQAVRLNILPERMSMVEHHRILYHTDPEQLASKYPYTYLYLNQRQFFDVLVRGTRPNCKSTTTQCLPTPYDNGNYAWNRVVLESDLEVVLPTAVVINKRQNIYADPTTQLLMVNCMSMEVFEKALTKLRIFDGNILDLSLIHI